MSRFVESDRAQRMDVLQRPEDVFTELGAPSWLASVVFTALSDEMGVGD
jgi:hypothetical protein